MWGICFRLRGHFKAEAKDIGGAAEAEAGVTGGVGGVKCVEGVSDCADLNVHLDIGMKRDGAVGGGVLLRSRNLRGKKIACDGSEDRGTVTGTATEEC